MTIGGNSMPPERSIVCLVPVRNDAWILDLFLRAASLWADVIVVSDQASHDESAAIAAAHPKVELVRFPPSWTFDEADHRAALIAAARARVPGPRVLVSIDSDELFAATLFESRTWRTALNAPPGTAIASSWMNLLPGLTACWPSPGRVIGFVDDGAPYAHPPGFHKPRLPPDLSHAVWLEDVPLLHYQYVDWARMRAKHRWYQCLERLQTPCKSPLVLYREYHHMDSVVPSARRQIDPSWFRGYLDRGVNPHAVSMGGPYWYDDAVLDLFDAHGTGRFAREAIWDQDWVEIARRRGRRNAESYRDPRKPAERLLHRWLARTQPSRARRRWTRGVDRCLRRCGF